MGTARCIKAWGRSWKVDSKPSRPTSLEILEPRILLSGDGLVNIVPDPLQDALGHSTPQLVQHAELLETNEQVEQQMDAELDPSDRLDAEVPEPLFTLTVGESDAKDEGSPVQTSDDLTVVPDDSVVRIDSRATAAEAVSITAAEPATRSSAVPLQDGGMPVHTNDSDLSTEYATSIEIRGPSGR